MAATMKRKSPYLPGSWALLQELFDAVGQGYRKGATPYPVERVAPLLPGMAGVGQRLGQMGLGGVDGRFRADQDAAIRKALSGEKAYDVSPEAVNEMFTKGVAQPAISSWERDFLPVLKEKASASRNLFSAGARRQEVESGRRLAESLSSQRAKFQLANIDLQAKTAEAANRRAMEAIPMASRLSLDQLMAESTLASALGPFQQHQQQLAEGRFQQAARMFPEANPWSNQMLNAIMLGGKGVFVSGQSGFTNTMDDISQTMGAVGDLLTLSQGIDPNMFKSEPAKQPPTATQTGGQWNPVRPDPQQYGPFPDTTFAPPVREYRPTDWYA